jgi:hypothetical protein
VGSAGAWSGDSQTRGAREILTIIYAMLKRINLFVAVVSDRDYCRTLGQEELESF